MPVIQSKVDRSSDEFKKNTAAHTRYVKELRKIDDYVMQGGPERSRDKHLAGGKLLARDRITALLDDDANFLELGRQAAWRVYSDDVPSAGIVTGIGRIHGTECMIVANDATVKGGTYYPLTVKKHLRAQEIAEQNRLPCNYLVDSVGAFLPR
ncbi:MAG: methylcrotonoyl-CoA carboxylase, partial [Proteobacteria bacterium]|nr:methylcrotonoyl-CoA carboxylase [Pseudomonadota bacterium]